MRKVLVIGINYYEKCGQLHGCVTDACDVKNALERNADGTLNFDVQTLLATCDRDRISKVFLKEKLKSFLLGIQILHYFITLVMATLRIQVDI